MVNVASHQLTQGNLGTHRGSGSLKRANVPEILMGNGVFGPEELVSVLRVCLKEKDNEMGDTDSSEHADGTVRIWHVGIAGAK
jgi:hypothetical protein